MNRLSFIRGVLYRLKRNYGSLADIYHQESETVDLATGRKTVVKTKLSVKRAILMPTRVHSSFSYDLSFLAANKNFTYGGIYALCDRVIILDRRDLPNEYDLSRDYMNKYIIIDLRRYEISEIEEFDHKAGYMVKLKHTKGAQLSQIVELKVLTLVNVDVESEDTVES